jgi:GT2 family glycosyltransferase
MRLGLVVTTYERPDALGRVFETIARQTSAPDELVVADDGSGPATRELIAGFASGVTYPVRHVWREHRGYGHGRMCNRGFAATQCEYVVLLDGDMLLDPHFLADHRNAARPGCYAQGCRILLDAPATARALVTGELPRFTSRGLGLRRRLYALRAPRLSRLLTRAANGLLAIKSCNQGFWRADLTRVNGFDEELAGWGPADKELCLRLENSGVRRRSILFGAIAYHLDHPPADRSFLARNRAGLEASRAAGRTRCDHGIVAPTGEAR